MVIKVVQHVLRFIKRQHLGFRRIPVKFSMGTGELDIPVVVVLGETGVGKTKLAVELCRRFNGEVISADSMQIYEGLDIITNKVTPEEACGIPHHLISVVSPLASNFNVQVFQKRANKIIEEMWTDRGALPVIVGGTNYYIEALLWNRLVNSDQSEETNEEVSDDNFVFSIPFDVTVMSDDEVHAELRRIDPITADRTHPRNRRRVIRSIQIFYQTGRPHSEWLSDQRSKAGGSVLGGQLRFKRLCVLWLTCDKEKLKERLRSRVDEMVSRGLREEISTFYDRYYKAFSEKYGSDATTKGILQSIGLKEFESYLKLAPSDRSTDVGAKAFEDGAEKLKLVTIKYARKQQQWITNRFCRLAARDSVPIYCFDTTNASQWPEMVTIPTDRLVDAFLTGRQPDVALKVASIPEENLVPNENVEHKYCQVCQRLISGLQWEEHTKSRTHRLLRVTRAKGHQPSDITPDPPERNVDTETAVIR